MPCKAVSKLSAVSKKAQDEDIERPPQSSDDEDPLPIKPTIFHRSSEKSEEDEKPEWKRKQEASKAAITRKVGKIILNNSNASSAARNTRGKGAQLTPTSSQSSDSSKRKNQDEELVSTRLGVGMADEWGRAKVKRRKNLKTFTRTKPSRTQSSEFEKPDPITSSDNEDTPRKFVNPGLLDTPKRTKTDAGSSFKTVDTSCFDSPLSASKSSDFKLRLMSDSPARDECKRELEFRIPEMDPDNSFGILDSNLGSSPFSMLKDKGGSPGESLPQATQKVFMTYDLDFDDSSLVETAQDLLKTDGSLPQRSSGPAPVLNEDDCVAMITSETHCPMCGDTVDPADLSAYGAMNTRMQEKFCRSHRIKTAENEWKVKGYPNIDWLKLDSRISEHHAFIKKLISGEDSYYRDLLSEKVNSGQDRSLKTMTSNLIPGYYGARGLRIMSENIMQKFTALLKKRMVKDRLMSARGFTPYVQSVLVPEVAVLLVMEDMHVSIEEARTILINSAGAGELLNEEIREVVRKRIDDSDNSEDDQDELIDD